MATGKGWVVVVVAFVFVDVAVDAVLVVVSRPRDAEQRQHFVVASYFPKDSGSKESDGHLLH